MKNLQAAFKLKRNFVSEIDHILAALNEFDSKKSDYQQQEIAQYQALMAKRDIKTNPSS
jgi:hypothetical protein